MKRTLAAAMATSLMLTIVVAEPVMSAPAPPPGGHIPVAFGGANRGRYPAIPSGVEENQGTATPALGDVLSAPNPFGSETVIRFTSPPNVEAHLTIFDLRGRAVREFLHRAGDAGVQEVVWDGCDREGNRLRVGIYFYRVEAAGHAVARKLVLLY